MLDCKNYCSTLWEYEPTCRHFPFFLNKYIHKNAFSRFWHIPRTFSKKSRWVHQLLLLESLQLLRQFFVAFLVLPYWGPYPTVAVHVAWHKHWRQEFEVPTDQVVEKNDEFYYVLLVHRQACQCPHCRQPRRHPHLCPLCPLLQRATQVRLDLFEHREQVTFWQRGRSCTCL